jgi:anti-anti-sigma factor
MSPNVLDLEVHRDGEVYVFIARGEIDMANSEELERRLTDPLLDTTPRVLDLAGLRYLDSAGFRALHRAALVGPLLLVVPEDARVARTVALAGFGAVVPVVGSLEEAMSLTG